MRTFSGIIIFLLMVNICLSGVIDKVIAKVNDDVITMRDLDAEMEQILVENPLLIEPDEIEKIKQDKLQEMIDNLLLIQAAKADSEPVPEEIVVAEINKYLAELRSNAPKDIPFEMYLESRGTSFSEVKEKVREVVENKYIVSQAVNKRIRRLLNDDTEYNKDELKTKYRVSHILLRFPEKLTPEIESKIKVEALEIVKALRKGKSFEELAKICSDDDANKLIGGDLGYFDEGHIPEPFDKIVPNLDVEEISDPIKSNIGYHIIKLSDKITVDDLIYSEKYKEERKCWIEELRKKARIKVFYPE